MVSWRMIKLRDRKSIQIRTESSLHMTRPWAPCQDILEITTRPFGLRGCHQEKASSISLHRSIIFICLPSEWSTCTFNMSTMEYPLLLRTKTLVQRWGWQSVNALRNLHVAERAKTGESGGKWLGVIHPVWEFRDSGVHGCFDDQRPMSWGSSRGEMEDMQFEIPVWLMEHIKS
jgi:hypothetical protein